MRTQNLIIRAVKYSAGSCQQRYVCGGRGGVGWGGQLALQHVVTVYRH